MTPLIRMPALLPMTTGVPLPQRVPGSAPVLIVAAVLATPLRSAVPQ